MHWLWNGNREAAASSAASSWGLGCARQTPSGANCRLPLYCGASHGIEGLDSGMFFKYRTDNGTRGHSWALAKERCKLDIRKYAFSQRTINEWNRLPGECVNATSVNMFKNKIDNYFKRSGYV